MRTIVCFGDSVTQGTPYVQLHDTFPEVLARRLAMRVGGEVRCINSGAGGENTAEGLARIQADVLDQRPEVVVVEFGLNDIRYEPEKHVPAAEFAANLSEIHGIIVATGAAVVFTTPNQVILPYHGYSKLDLPFYEPWGDVTGLLAEYAGVVREVAAEVGAHLCDVYRALEDKALEAEFAGACADWQDLRCLAPYISSADGVHPTAAGQALIAAELYKVLVRAGLV